MAVGALVLFEDMVMAVIVIVIDIVMRRGCTGLYRFLQLYIL